MCTSLFVTLVPLNVHRVELSHIFAIMEQHFYLLKFNSEVLIGAKNLRTLWKIMHRRCFNEGKPLPQPYHTLRRQMVLRGEATHLCGHGWTYQIIIRQMVKKDVQQNITFEPQPLNPTI